MGQCECEQCRSTWWWCSSGAPAGTSRRSCNACLRCTNEFPAFLPLDLCCAHKASILFSGSLLYPPSSLVPVRHSDSFHGPQFKMAGTLLFWDAFEGAVTYSGWFLHIKDACEGRLCSIL